MSTTPTPPATPTAAQLTTPTAAQNNAFDVAYFKSFPIQFWQEITGLTAESPSAIFFILKQPSGSESPTTPTNVTLGEINSRANVLAGQGFGDLMLDAICWKHGLPSQTMWQWYLDGIPWYPAKYINGVEQPNLGQPGQYALPNDFEPGAGLLGPYPTTKPEGWINVVTSVGGASLLPPGVKA